MSAEIVNLEDYRRARREVRELKLLFELSIVLGAIALWLYVLRLTRP